MNNRYLAENENEMLALGKSLFQVMQSEGVIFLHGDLGMGKTTLCRGVVLAAGHVGAVKSPTYTLVEPYSFGQLAIHHFDLYRLSDPEELEYLGIRDYFSAGMLSLIEWPEKGKGFLPEADIEITITLQGVGRQLTFVSNTLKGEKSLRKLAEIRKDAM